VGDSLIKLKGSLRYLIPRRDTIVTIDTVFFKDTILEFYPYYFTKREIDSLEKLFKN